MPSHFSTVLLTLLISTFSQQAYSQTIWCRSLNLGCLSEEEKAKAIENCKRKAAATKQEAFTEALADPRVWQLSGARSAYDYAQIRENTMMNICLKNQS